MITVRRRRDSGWRAESDSAAVFRWYERGSPTGHVAVAAWEEPDEVGRTLSGHGVWLVRGASRITIGERLENGRIGSRFDVPLSACRSVELVEEVDSLRFTLTARLGPGPGVSVPLRFPIACHRHLCDLVAAIADRPTGWVSFGVTDATARLLRELGVRR